MFRYAFRLHRWGIIGYGLVVVFSTVAQGAAFTQLAGTSAASRAQFAQGMSALAAQLSYLLPPGHRLDTLAGYVLWRAWGTLPIVISVWAVAAAAGAVRGDERKQLVDSWLAARVSRLRLVATRLAAFAAAALIVAVAAGIGTLLGAAGTETIGLDRIAGQALALWLFAFALYALVFLVAQVPASLRAAQGTGAALLVVLYILNAIGRSVHSLDAIAWVSPYRWYDATDVLAPGGHLDVVGVGLSVAVILVAGGLSVLAFSRRDIRGPLLTSRVVERRASDTAPSPALAWPVARQLYRQRWVILTWALGCAIFGGYIVGIARSVVDTMLRIPGLRELLTQVSGDPYRGYIGVYWFSIAQLLLAGLAIHLVAGWASDDTDGVLEAILSQPQRRSSIILERALAAVVALAAVATVGTLVVAFAARAAGITLDAANAVRATWPLAPFALTFAAAGAVGTSRWPRAAVGALGMLAFVSFLASELAPLLHWPDWALNLSVWRLYGTPFISGIYWTGLWLMVAFVVVGFGLAVVLMQGREVGA